MKCPNLSNFIEIDEKVSKCLPSSFLDGSHLSILFTMTHSEDIRGENYKGFNTANEMGLFSFLRDNKDIDINVETILKMYAVLSNEETASFRKENIHIKTSNDKFYVPTSGINVEKEMNLLCERFNYLNHPKADDFDDIFKFILQFICIHPFHNGNGRLSAFLISLLLMKFGLKNALYLPIDALMNGLYIERTTQEIRKASGFFYKMKEYDYDSYISYMKELIMKSYKLLLKSSESIKK